MSFKNSCVGQQLRRQVDHKSCLLNNSANTRSIGLPSFRTHATATASRSREDSLGQQNQVNQHAKGPLGRRAQQKEADREFFADLISSAATKRDAKAYLSRLKTPSNTKTPSTTASLFAKGSYVNLGNLFPGSRAAEQSPVFSQSVVAEEYEESERLHVAIVKIKDIATLSGEVLFGIAETLAQLNRLSISPCVVMENSGNVSRAELSEEADKLVAAIGEVENGAARRVDNVFSTTCSGKVAVSQRKLLLRPLRRGQIPVVVTVAYDEDTQQMTVVPAADATLALTKEFAGSNVRPRNSKGVEANVSEMEERQRDVSLDRLITIDSAGGIINEKAADGRHIFLNLEQEYDIVKGLLAARSHEGAARIRQSNLDLLREALQILPATSSGLMTTYEEAANIKPVSEDQSASSVGTRRQKNTLVHNVLTDKPAYSSSLPLGRLGRKNNDGDTNPVVSHSSFVKRGMQLNILPNPFQEPWTPTATRLKLTDSRIDLDRLVYLIEDSFGRKLDVQDYLNRVNDKIAGVIIAGEYEGGAILTWETPPNNANAEPVPYLDKFAVLRRSQGAGGVADIVFNAMVRSCFPNGVCWRSRGGNPVNKWYMERSRGTWKLSKAWTMFWTTPGIEMDTARFKDYEEVCRGVLPSWIDRQKPAD